MSELRAKNPAYVVQEHRPRGLVNPTIGPWTLWSEQRQAKKKMRAVLGGMSGRQWKKHRKALKRAVTDGTLVPTMVVDDTESQP